MCAWYPVCKTVQRFSQHDGGLFLYITVVPTAVSTDVFLFFFCDHVFQRSCNLVLFLLQHLN